MRIFKPAVFFLLVVLMPYQILAAGDVRTIAVTGKSETTVQAHNAVIQIGVREVNAAMSQSHAALIKTISELTGQLRKIGLSDADIRKSLILQGQERAWEKNANVPKGYYSECFIDLVVSPIDRIAAVYEGLSNYPDVTIRGTDFKRNDEFELRKAEIEKALRSAREKAEYMAQALGARIGKVHTIQEGGAGEAAPRMLAAKAAATEGGDAPSGYGNIRISGVVVVEFELE